MVLFEEGDRVLYIGDSIAQREANIVGIKTISSGANGKPIYYVKFEGDTDTYGYGIYEHNLTLVKRKAPIWKI